MIVFFFGAFCYASVHLNFCLEQIVASHLKYSRLNGSYFAFIGNEFLHSLNSINQSYLKEPRMAPNKRGNRIFCNIIVHQLAKVT